MLGYVINLIFIGGLIYEIFLSPTPDEEVLQQESIETEEYIRDHFGNIIFCIAGLVITNIIAIIDYIK